MIPRLVCLRRKLIDDEKHRGGKALLDRIPAMLVKLAFQDR